jgi:hypothetical protein
VALTVPNLDRIAKDNPKLGELAKKVQDYVNANVTPVAGNRVPAPPIDPTRPPG